VPLTARIRDQMQGHDGIPSMLVRLAAILDLGVAASPGQAQDLATPPEPHAATIEAVREACAAAASLHCGTAGCQSHVLVDDIVTVLVNQG
jgi:hypothetical protein